MIDISKTHIHLLIDSMPSNLVLYKDSGLWNIWDDFPDENEDPIYSQLVSEDFDTFIRRVWKTMYVFEDGEGFMGQELAAKEYDYKRKSKQS